MSTDLLKMRERIDAIDTQVLALLSERARCAEAVAHAKRAVEENPVFYRPEREAQILRRMVSLNQGPLRDEQITHLYREIISACLALEESMTIAYLGPEGTFTQEAALKHFGNTIGLLSCDSIAQVFREVETYKVRYGVVPIENSTEGIVSHTLDTLVNSPLKICGEIVLRIHQNLLCVHDNWQGVEKVYSHAQSLAQCRYWLDKNLPNVERIACSSNADAARRAAAEPKSAALGSVQAAPIYGLKVMQTSVEDNANNTTRFLILGHHDVGPSGQDKTSLLLSTPNRPGSLYELLKTLAHYGVDLTRIESRPARSNNWEYLFFLDMRGHAKDEALSQALQSLQQQVDLVRVLGSYPVAVM